jgi:hypothetical protein
VFDVVGESVNVVDVASATNESEEHVAAVPVYHCMLYGVAPPVGLAVSVTLEPELMLVLDALGAGAMSAPLGALAGVLLGPVPVEYTSISPFQYDAFAT